MRRGSLGGDKPPRHVTNNRSRNDEQDVIGETAISDMPYLPNTIRHAAPPRKPFFSPTRTEATSMRLPAITLATVLLCASQTAFADQPMPSGTWQCEGSGNCVDVNTVHRNPPMASAQGIVHYRSGNHRGVIVKNCNSGVVTATGIEGMAEDWPIQADFKLMCKDAKR